tara:strand:- start:2405 stop:4174 length:1770 start_codon:yes stop_codon:yes gene_type:complete
MLSQLQFSCPIRTKNNLIKEKNMCGINGFNWQDIDQIKTMNQAIKHRGPNDDGTFVGADISLGHVRLSILDLSSRGHQPMYNNVKGPSVQIVYNGEIYNFKEIKNVLIKEGFEFQTDTDTEVVLNAYIHYGVDAFSLFNGIFSFGIFDQDKGKLFLVRDRLGIKPLYYKFTDGQLIFSSETKAIKTIVPLEINDNKRWDYFLSHNVSDESLYYGIKSVTPGSYLCFNQSDSTIKEDIYCNLGELVKPKVYKTNEAKTETQLVDELDELLNDVVKDQMVSDAPIGTIGSGGLDSSLVSAIAAQYNKNLDIYHIKVDEKKCDESIYARQVAQHLKLNLVEEVLSKESYLQYLDHCLKAEELPLSHPNSVGIYQVSKKAIDTGVKVLLSGEGADELFGGYHRYRNFQKRLWVNQFPIVKKILNKLSDLTLDETFQGYRSDDLALLGEYLPEFPHFKNRSNYNKIFEEAFNFIDDDQERAMKAFISGDLGYYLPSILRRTDRMSMSVGLEMRVPFLDNRLIDFSLNLPVKFQVSKQHQKHLLKKVGERYLPKDIVYRAKKGFPLPIEQWLESKHFKKEMYARWHKLQQINVGS